MTHTPGLGVVEKGWTQRRRQLRRLAFSWPVWETGVSTSASGAVEKNEASCRLPLTMNLVRGGCSLGLTRMRELVFPGDLSLQPQMMEEESPGREQRHRPAAPGRLPRKLFYRILFVCLFLAALGLWCFFGLSVVAASGATRGWGGRASHFVASLTAERGFQTRGFR